MGMRKTNNNYLIKISSGIAEMVSELQCRQNLDFTRY